MTPSYHETLNCQSETDFPLRVAVLLSTKNGAQFLAEQITSIMSQTYRHKRLLWRDDGSTDKTVTIMRETFHLVPLGVANRGITQSYAILLRFALTHGYELFALSDQDDVWAIDKLERAVVALRGLTGPALYCARQTWVDTELRPIGASARFRQPIGFPAALTQNVAAGCTIMLNRAAAELVSQTLHEQHYHDWWCYLIVAAAGGRVITDDAEVIRYRQHEGNLIGAPSTYLRRAVNAVRRGSQTFMMLLRHHIAQLQAHEKLLSPAARHDLTIIADALQQGFPARWRALNLPGFRRQTLREDLVFRLWFLFG